MLPSSDEQRGRNRFVFLLSECGVAVALEYFAGFLIEMKTPLRDHAIRDVKLVVRARCVCTCNIQDHPDTPHRLSECDASAFVLSASRSYRYVAIAITLLRPRFSKGAGARKRSSA